MKNTENLIKGKDVIGLKVITHGQGKDIDNVDELVYDPTEGKVVALVVDKGGWFRDAKVILFDDITSIGKDAVMVESDAVLHKASDIKNRIHRIVRDDNYLTENSVITEDGTDLGKISDIYFNPDSGMVEEFEVSQGLKDIQSGKKRVRTTDVVKVGEDATIVKGYVEEQLDQQAQEQGIQGMINEGKDRMPGIIEETKEKVRSAADTTRQKFDEMKNDPQNRQKVDDLKNKALEIKDSAGEKIEEKRKSDAVGKYLSVNILGPEDRVLAHRGDMITNDLLDQAKEAGVLDQVLSSADAEPVITPGVIAPQPAIEETEKVEA